VRGYGSLPEATAKRSPADAPTVVDATGLILGRAASCLAQRLLAGESIVVVNAEQAVVTGSRSTVLATYVAARARGSVRSGPHFPRYPDRIFRRTVRGMLPHLRSRGKTAFARLVVHIGVPAELSGAPRTTIAEAKARPALRAPMTLAEITRLLGAHV
jgi:large subunit ribosomal protein L13